MTNTTKIKANKDHEKRRVLITGSADGLGYAVAKSLLEQGHEVVVHVRSSARLSAVEGLVALGARVVTGDLSDITQIRDLARQVNEMGPMDAVIHNASIFTGSQMLVVNVVAPYLLTALIQRPRRLIYLSSSMHRDGSANISDMDWSGRESTGGYSDSKLFVTAMAAAVARRWPDCLSNAVDPGWVPTKMGGPDAPGDLQLGQVTQEWLAVSDEPEALTTGGYWHHQKREHTHRAVNDVAFQDELLLALEAATGTSW